MLNLPEIRTGHLERIVLQLQMFLQQHLGQTESEQTLAVTEVNKIDHQVTTTPNPTSERNGLADMLARSFSAGMRMHAVQINSCVSGIILGVF